MHAMSEVALNTLLYGLPSQSTIDYFRDKVTYLQNFATTAFGWAKEELQSVFNRNYSDAVLVEARNVLQESEVMFRDEHIHSVSYDNYRPNLMTQMYIMECPEVRNMYNKGLVSGFDGTYLDPEPKIDNYMFRDGYAKVMNGIVTEVENDPGTEVTWYPHLEDTETLDFKDQTIMLRNWEIARALIADDEDPTIIR